MKMYTTAAEADQMIIPSGDKFPNNPKVGSLFKLMRDAPITQTVDRWYGAGTYVYNYGAWERINESGRQRVACEIAPRTVVFEAAPLKPRIPPKPTDGLQIAHKQLSPVNRASSYSGIATLWVEPEMDCQVVLAIFRDDKRLIGMSVEAVQRGKPRNMSVSFYDMPFTGVMGPQVLSVTYTLHICCDALGAVALNRGGSQFVYDDVAPSTAFLISENT